MAIGTLRLVDDQRDLDEAVAALIEPGEVWRVVPGSDLYGISSLGRIFSMRSKILLRPSANQWGHLQVRLRIDGRRRFLLVHRLVAFAFILNPAPRRNRLVRHLNDLKTDNRIANLAWGNDQDNADDYARNLLHRKVRRGF